MTNDSSATPDSKPQTGPADPPAPVPMVERVEAHSVVIAQQAVIHAGGIIQVVGVAAIATDPLSAEIEANRALISRGLHAEALDGFRGLLVKCPPTTDASRSLVRIRNNMGVCLFALRRHNEAKAEFHMALALEPSFDPARTNLAGAYLVMGEPDCALELLDRLPAEDLSLRSKAAAIYIGALDALDRFDDVRAFIGAHPWMPHDAHVQVALIRMETRRGDLSNLERRLSLACQNIDCAFEALTLAGMAYLGIAGLTDTFIPIRGDRPEAALRKALSMFIGAADACPAWAKSLKADAKGNTGLIHSLLGETDLALDCFHAARSLCSSPSSAVVRNHAALLMQGQQFEAAADLIRASGLFETNLHLRFQLAVCLGASGKWTQVMDAMKGAWSTLAGEDRLHGAALVLRAARELHDADTAAVVTDALRSSFPAHWATWFYLARHEADGDRRDTAAPYFRRALELAPDDEAKRMVREEFGYRQAVWGDHLGAAETLREVAINDLGDAGAQALVVSLFNLQDHKLAREAADVLLGRTKLPVQIIEVATQIASLAGDVVRAINLQRRRMAAFEVRLQDRTQLAMLHVRNGDHAAARLVMDCDIASLPGSGDATDLMVAAYLLASLGDGRALDVGFRAWERGRDREDICSGYAGLFLVREQDDGPRLEGPIMAAGWTARLDVVGSQIPGTRILSVVRDEDLIPDAATWLRVDDDLAKRLIGKQVGDTVVGSSSPFGTTTYMIGAVYSNKVRAFQEVFAQYNERFPEGKALRKIEFGDDPTEPVRKLLALRQGVRPALDFYAQGKIPLATLAGLLSGSEALTWGKVVSDPVVPVLRFSRGVDHEQEVARQLLDRPAEQPVILDYTALMTLVLCDDVVRSSLTRALGRTVLLQSVLDDIQDGLSRAVPRRRESGVSASLRPDGKLQAAPLDDTHGFLSRVMATARSVASPIPSYSSIEARTDDYRHLFEALGAPTAETLIEATSRKAIVVCDDLVLATACRSRGTQTVSLQSVAQACVRRGTMNLETYAALVEQLASAKYQFVSVNAETVVAVMARHEWRADERVRVVLRLLKGPDCSTRSAASVIAHVLKAVVLEPNAALHQDVLVRAVLDCASPGHDAAELIYGTRSALGWLLRLAPVQGEHLEHYLQAWLKYQSTGTHLVLVKDNDAPQ